MSFVISIPSSIFQKDLKFKENEQVDWSKKNLKEQSEAEVVIDLSAELGIEPKGIFKHLKVNIGELVKEGHVLAEKKGFLHGKKIKAPQQAEIRKINHENGTLTLAVKQTLDVPFSLKAKFVKKDHDQQLIFKVDSGVEVGLQASLDTSFGGECFYLDNSKDITLENVEGKIVVFNKLDMMDQAKLAALGPLATVSYEATYHNTAVPLLLLAQKEAYGELFAKKWKLCLYLIGKKTVYFYQP